MALQLRFNPFTATFDYVDIPTSTGMTPVPLAIAAGDTYTIAANTQVLYATEITNNGTIVNNGAFIKLRSA